MSYVHLHDSTYLGFDKSIASVHKLGIYERKCACCLGFMSLLKIEI